MKIKFMLKGTIHNKDWGVAIGSYSCDKDLATIHLGRLWKQFDKKSFKYQLKDSITHETLHSVIMKILKTDNIKLKFELTYNEWIVRRLLQDKMDEFTLLPYIMEDVYICQTKRALADVMKIVGKLKKWYLIGMISVPILALLLTLLLKWGIEKFIR